MNPAHDRGPLTDMLDSAREAVGMFEAAGADALESDRQLHFALLHLVQTVGEAATRVSAETRDAHPEIPWALVIGMRNRIVHGYDQIATDLVHDTVAGDLPRLIEQLTAILRGKD